MHRQLPEFVIHEELSIPEGYADLGDRQLNEILSKAHYHIRRRCARDSLHEQCDASRALRSTSDVRDTPGGSRGPSVQPSEPPTRPKARPRTESPSGPNVHQRTEAVPHKAPAMTAYATGNPPAHDDMVYDDLGYPIDPTHPRPDCFICLDGIRWARMKVARDPCMQRGLEDRARNDHTIVGHEHIDYFLAGQEEFNVRGERIY